MGHLARTLIENQASAPELISIRDRPILHDTRPERVSWAQDQAAKLKASAD